MKTILAVILTILAGSIAAVQSQSTAVPPQERPSSAPARPNGDDERARIAAPNDWPQRPQVAQQARPLTYTVFKTNCLVNNESDKQIRAIKWTATLVNCETQETIQTLPFETRKKIGPHKSITLKERVVVPLKKLHGQVVSATQPINDPTKIPLDGKYEIVEILYADKSVSKP